MHNFDVDFPVVGRVCFSRSNGGSNELVVSDAYFFFLMTRIVERIQMSGARVWPALALTWHHVEGPWSVTGAELVLNGDDGLLNELDLLHDAGFNLDLSHVTGGCGAPPAPSSEVLAALIHFLREAFEAHEPVHVVTLP